MIGLNFTQPIVFEPLFMERCCQLQHSGGSDHYQKFRDYLEARYPVIVRNDNTCLIFRLAGRAAQL